MAAPRILVLNAGSSSLKAGLIELPDSTLGRAEASWGSDASRSGDRATGVAQVLRDVAIDSVAERSRPIVDAVGYRVVHGGSRFTAAVAIDDSVIAGIERVLDLAPLHNGVALETIRAGRSLLPGVPHVAAFDTAFHASLEAHAYRYPVPEKWLSEWGIRRYGFHGLSVTWAVQRAADLLARPAHELSLLVAHLGSGCSVTAVRAGRSVDTSMGLTPLEGLMMGTRSGSIDPGVLLHLLKAGKLDVERLGEALDHHSGLAGVSGLGGDMRALLEAEDDGDPRAALAVTMFVGRAAAWIASMATSLPKVDALVFTGGIGEHSDPVRRRIVDRLGPLNVAPLSPISEAGIERDGFLSARQSGVPVLRVAAREDLVIAAEAAAVLFDAQDEHARATASATSGREGPQPGRPAGRR